MELNLESVKSVVNSAEDALRDVLQIEAPCCSPDNVPSMLHELENAVKVFEAELDGASIICDLVLCPKAFPMHVQHFIAAHVLQSRQAACMKVQEMLKQEASVRTSKVQAIEAELQSLGQDLGLPWPPTWSYTLLHPAAMEERSALLQEWKAVWKCQREKELNVSGSIALLERVLSPWEHEELLLEEELGNALSPLSEVALTDLQARLDELSMLVCRQRHLKSALLADGKKRCDCLGLDFSMPQQLQEDMNTLACGSLSLGNIKGLGTRLEKLEERQDHADASNWQPFENACTLLYLPPGCLKWLLSWVCDAKSLTRFYHCCKACAWPHPELSWHSIVDAAALESELLPAKMDEVQARQFEYGPSLSPLNQLCVRQNFNRLCKILIAGDADAGKTAVLSTLRRLLVSQSFVPLTYGRVSWITPCQGTLECQLIQQEGQELPRGLRPWGVMLVCDLTKISSTRNLRRWLYRIRRTYSKIQIVVCGINAHQPDRTVSTFDLWRSCGPLCSCFEMNTDTDAWAREISVLPEALDVNAATEATQASAMDAAAEGSQVLEVVKCRLALSPSDRVELPLIALARQLLCEPALHLERNLTPRHPAGYPTGCAIS